MTMAPPAPKFEFEIDGVWTDYTSYVMRNQQIIITRGEANESSRLTTTRAQLMLRNDKTGSVGLFSNDNPSSPLFRKLGPATRCRISRGSDIRAVLALRQSSQHWSHGERTAWVPIQATGIFGQLAQGGRALDSPVYRDIMRRHNDDYRVAYWPMEEGSRATRFESPMSGVVPLFVSEFGSLQLAAFSSPGSLPLPTLTTGVRITATVPSYSTTTHKVVQLWNVLDAGVSTQTTLCRLMGTGGTIGYWDLDIDTSGNLRLAAYATDGTLFDATGFIAHQVEGWHFLTSIELTQDGSDVDTRVLVQKIATEETPPGAAFFDDTFAGCTIGRISRVIIAPNADVNDISVGHLAVSNNIATGLSGLNDSTNGHWGERAARRVQRLCDEEGITLGSGGGNFDQTAQMGIQTQGTLLEQFDECIVADQGMLRENRTIYALTYIPGHALTNLAPVVTLDYDSSHFGDGTQIGMPVSDDGDALLHNDVTVRRANGSFARDVLESGRLSIQEPPDGVGTYDRGPVSANVMDDNQLPHLAGWIRNVRTPMERRWVDIQLQLARSVFENDTALRDDVSGALVGNCVALTNMPEFVAPEAHYAVLRGWKETITKELWHFNWYTSPYWPLEVTPVETSGSKLVHAVNAAATTWRLSTSEGPEWDTTLEPYFIQAAGEAVKVTAMVTATPAFIAAGTAAHGNNASVSPGLPAGITPDVGQALIVKAAIRNSGTGTVDLPAGWTNLVNFGNVRYFGKYYVTGDTAPTVTFTGGAANADTSAQMAAWSGVSLELDDGRYGASTPSPQTQLNSSAQDMAYPALSVRRANCLVILGGWKQDDWTSVATPAAMDAEIGEPDTTTGDDQGIAWYYDIQSSATNIAAGSMVVTGGAAAISRAVVFALRPLQTATVERAVNGVSGSISANEDVTTWRLGVNLL